MYTHRWVGGLPVGLAASSSVGGGRGGTINGRSLAVVHHMHPWRGNRGREPAEQRERIHVDSMRAIPKWLAEGDAHETVREQAESFLGQRRAKHVFAQGFAATRILCPSMGRSMQAWVAACRRDPINHETHCMIDLYRRITP